jgi:nucleoid DNA-binding protein
LVWEKVRSFAPKGTHAESSILTGLSSTFESLPSGPNWTKKDPKTGKRYQIAVSDCRGQLLRFRLLLLRQLRPVKHSHIANPGDQMAAALFGELRSQFLLLLLELVEFHFDQLVMMQQFIQRPEELRAQTFLAHLQRGLEPLSLGFETSDLRTIPGLGKIVLVNRKARMARNPATGEAIKIAAKRVVKFRVAKAAKDAILGSK